LWPRRPTLAPYQATRPSRRHHIRAHRRGGFETCLEEGNGTFAKHAEIRDKHGISPIPSQIKSLNDALYKQAVYEVGIMKQITAWADIRNNAAHGHYDKVDAKQVELMVAGIRHYILSYPA
jgi:hypothetical protein